MICYHCMRDKGDSPVCPYCGTAQLPPAEPHQLRPGTVIGGKYTVGRVLGEGGFGITYIGRNDYLETTVAIKEYYPYGYAQRNNEASCSISIATGRENDFYVKGRDRFLREAKTVAKFRRQSGIVEVEDFIEENNTAYIIMEYLDGVTLKEFLRKHGVIKPEQAVALLTPTMQALAMIHRSGIIHRDISPDNIMYLKDGTVKLMDFGAARTYDTENRSLSVMLKPGYAPEEQYRRGGEQGPWTDVYGICATLYRCITGKAPTDAVDRLAEDTLQKPSQLGAAISPRLESVLMYGLALRKKDRCKDMDELLRLFGIALEEDAKYPTSAAAPAAAPYVNYQAPPSRTVAANTEHRDDAATLGMPAAYTRRPAQSYTQQPPVQAYSPAAATVNDPSKKKKSKKKAIAVIVSILLLVAVGATVGIILMLNNKPKPVDEKKIKEAENEYYSNGNIKVEKEADDDYNVVKETRYTLSGKVSGRSDYELDSNGNQIVEKVYNSAGRLRYTYKNEFDSDGNIIKSTEYDYSDELYGWYEYKYDSDGNAIREQWFYPSGATYTHYEREYDSSGNMIVEKKFNGYGHLVWTDEMEYDSSDKMTKLTEYDDQGKKLEEYEYDADENIKKRTVYDDSESIESYYLYEYDSDGYNVKRTEYDDSDSRGYVYEYEFDDNGNNTNYHVYDETDKQVYNDVYLFDSRGVKTQATTYDSDGDIFYKLEYDKHESISMFYLYDSSGSLKNSTEYERDKDRTLMKTIRYDSKGSIEEYEEYEYDKNGNYSKISTYNAAKELQSYKVYEYDDAGNETGSTTYDADGNTVAEDSE